MLNCLVDIAPLGAGELPDSVGGLFNPGACVWQSRLLTLIRREQYHDCRTYVPPWLLWAGAEIPSQPLTLVGHHRQARLEDCRPFVWKDQILVTHTQVWNGRVKPTLSSLDPLNATLTRWDDLNLPIPLQRVEKNWVLVSDAQEELYLIYSLSPLIIFQRMGEGKWVQCTFDAGWKLPFLPRCSTHLLPMWGGYLGFWHTKLDYQYVHGAYWLDGKLDFGARTGILFDSADVRSGFKPGVRYLSSWTPELNSGDHLRLWCGLADTSIESSLISTAQLKHALEFGGPLDG